MKLFSASLILLAGLISAGCDAASSQLPPGDAQAEDGFALTTDRDAYARGQAVMLTVRNGGAQALVMNVPECAEVEQWRGERWVPRPSGQACIDMALYLAPGGARRARVQARLDAGTYRLVHSATREREGSSVRAATAPFRVR